MGREIERLALFEDRPPGQVTAHCLLQILEPRLIRSQKHQRVAIEPWRGAPAFKNGRGCNFRRGPGTSVIGVLGAQNHQACLPLVRHFVWRPRRPMDAAEAAAVAESRAEPIAGRLDHPVPVPAQLLGAVFGQLGDRGMGVIPVAGAILVEVGGRSRQSPQGIPEDGRRLPRQDAAQLDAPVFEPALGRSGRRRRAQIDRARHPPASRALPQVRHLAVDPQRKGLGAIHVLLDHRHPVVGQVAGQLELHPRIVDRQVGGQDDGVAVPLLPEAVDDRRHQSQHAAGPLERHQRRPVGVEPVEDLRMDRISGDYALFVVGVAALGGELLVLATVELGERSGHHVTILELGRIGKGLEQPPPHDLEPLFGAGRPPGGFDPPDDVSQTVKRPHARAGRPPLYRQPGRGAKRWSPRAGRLTTSRQLPAIFTDSVNACAKVNCVSKLPAGRSLWS